MLIPENLSTRIFRWLLFAKSKSCQEYIIFPSFNKKICVSYFYGSVTLNIFNNLILAILFKDPRWNWNIWSIFLKREYFNIFNYNWFNIRNVSTETMALLENRSYSEFFWSVFSCIRTEYGETRSISPHSERMWENTEYGRFSRSMEGKKFFF